MTVMFEDGVLNGRQTLPIDKPHGARMRRETGPGRRQRPAVRLLPAGRHGHLRGAADRLLLQAPGFRVTLLECDDAKRAWILRTLRQSIDTYVAA